MRDVMYDIHLYVLQAHLDAAARLTYLLACLLACSAACLLAYLLTCLLAYLLTCLLAYLLT